MAASTSRSARAPGFPSRSTTFRATSRSACSSRASQTDPPPPLPSGRSGLYRPRTRLFSVTRQQSASLVVGSWRSVGKVLQSPDRVVDSATPSTRIDPCSTARRATLRPTSSSTSSTSRRPSRRRRRRSGRPEAAEAAEAAARPPGGPQLYRLGVLIAGAILLAVIFILVINNCRGDQKQSAYEGYMEDVDGVATESAQLGKELNERLTTPGIKLEALRANVEGLRSSSSRS